MAALLRTLTQQLTAANAHISKIVFQLRDGEFPTEKGLSILEVKNQMLAMYLSDLAQVIHRKLTGTTLRDEAAVMRLIEIRTVLEKLRPIDMKLRYQVDKLVKTVLTGKLDVGDPLTFKPNPKGLISQLSDDDEDNVGDIAKLPGMREPGLNPKKIYVPPHLVPMHYNADQSYLEKERKILERARKRALGSSVIRELQEQYTDAPEEQCDGRDYHSMRYSQEEKHRIQYEEIMMTRVNIPKEERTRRKRALAMTSQLGSLTHFGNIDVLTAETLDMDSVPQRKKRKTVKKTKKTKKGFRRRR